MIQFKDKNTERERERERESERENEMEIQPNVRVVLWESNSPSLHVMLLLVFACHRSSAHFEKLYL